MLIKKNIDIYLNRKVVQQEGPWEPLVPVSHCSASGIGSVQYSGSV